MTDVKNFGDFCSQCSEGVVTHTIGDKGYCCKCYVVNGNPPADWHTLCIETYNKQTNTQG